MLGRGGIGTHQKLLEVGDRGEACPYLLAVHDQFVALYHPSGAQRGKIRTCAGFGKSLAPDLVTAQDRRQVPDLLFLPSAGDQGRSAMVETDETASHPGRMGPRILLVPDELFDQRQAAPAVFFRPGYPGPAPFELLALPFGIEGRISGPSIGRGSVGRFSTSQVRTSSRKASSSAVLVNSTGYILPCIGRAVSRQRL